MANIMWFVHDKCHIDVIKITSCPNSSNICLTSKKYHKVSNHCDCFQDFWQKSDGLFNLVIYLGLIDDGWLKACVPLIFKVVQSQNWKVFAATGWIMLEGQSTLWVEPLFPAIDDILVKPLNIRGRGLFVGNWWHFLEDEIPRRCHLTIVVFPSFWKFVKVKILRY